MSIFSFMSDIRFAVRLMCSDCNFVGYGSLE